MNWKIVLILGVVFFGQVFISCCGFGKHERYRYNLQLLGLNEVNDRVPRQGDSMIISDKMLVNFYFKDTVVSVQKLSKAFKLGGDVYACSLKPDELNLLAGLKSFKIRAAFKLSDTLPANADISSKFYFVNERKLDFKFNLRDDFNNIQDLFVQNYTANYSSEFSIWTPDFNYVISDSLQLRYELEYFNGVVEERLSRKYKVYR